MSHPLFVRRACFHLLHNCFSKGFLLSPPRSRTGPLSVCALTPPTDPPSHSEEQGLISIMDVWESSPPCARSLIGTCVSHYLNTLGSQHCLSMCVCESERETARERKMIDDEEELSTGGSWEFLPSLIKLRKKLREWV